MALLHQKEEIAAPN